MRIIPVPFISKSPRGLSSSLLAPYMHVDTVATYYNEVPRYRKRGLRYSEDPVIKNYLVNSKNIRYSGVI